MKRQVLQQRLLSNPIVNASHGFYYELTTPYTLISRHKEERGVKLNDIYDVIEALNVIVYNIPVEFIQGFQKPIATVSHNMYLDRYRKFV